MNRIPLGNKFVAAARLATPFAIAEDHFLIAAKDTAMFGHNGNKEAAQQNKSLGAERCSIQTLQEMFAVASALAIKADELSPPQQIKVASPSQPPVPQRPEDVEEAEMPNMSEYRNSETKSSTLESAASLSDFTFCMLAQAAQKKTSPTATAEVPAAAAVVPPSANQAFMHVIKRRPGDFDPNNLIYHRLATTIGVHRNAEFASSLQALQNGEEDGATPHQRTSVIADELAPEATLYNRLMQKAFARTGEMQGTAVFWPHECDAVNSVAYATDRCMVLVNLKPIVPSHLMVVPLRTVSSISHLTSHEIDGLGESVWMALQVLQEVVPSADGFSIGIQQGAGAGQSVPHLHCHVIPFHADSKLAGEPEDEAHDSRVARTPEMMRAESEALRPLFAKVEALLRAEQ